MTQKIHLAGLVAVFMIAARWNSIAAEAPALPTVREVEAQPLAASIRRVIEAMNYLGAPLGSEDAKAIGEALASSAPADMAERLQELLDPYLPARYPNQPRVARESRAGPGAP